MLDFEQRLGSAWRPVEQTVVERSHQESQKELGSFLQEVSACAPGHWGEPLHLAEFVIWNTPGKHGFSPRDLVHGWSLASPLERELLPFELPQREAMSEIAAAQLEQFRNLRQRMLALRSEGPSCGGCAAREG